MRKKYLSALLFGALLFASAGTFTSCKDYDDDINNLQEQINTVVSDLASLKSQIDNLGTGVSSVTFDEATGVLTVVDGAGTHTYTIKTTAGEVADVKITIEGQELKVNGETVGKVGDTVTVVNGELTVNGEGTGIKVGEYTILDNQDAGTVTITLPDADGKLQTVVLAKASSALTSLKFEDEDHTDYVALGGGEIQWNVAATDKLDWAGKKGAIKRNQLLVGQISTVNVQVTPASFDLGSAELSLQDSKGNPAPVKVSAVQNNLLLTRSANSGSWLVAIEMNEDVTANNIAEVFDAKTGYKAYSLCVNGQPVSNYDIAVKVSDSEQTAVSFATGHDLAYIDAEGYEVDLTGTNKLQLGETTLYIKGNNINALYDSYITFEKTNQSLVNSIGIKADGMTITAPTSAAGQTVTATVHCMDVTGHETSFDVTFVVAASQAAEVSATPIEYVIMPLKVTNNEAADLEAIKFVKLNDTFATIDATTLEKVKNAGQIKIVEKDGQTGFLAASTDGVLLNGATADLTKYLYKADGTPWKADVDDLLDLATIQLPFGTRNGATNNNSFRVAKDAKPGNYTLYFVATEEDNANEIIRVKLDVEIAVPAFTDLFSKRDGMWSEDGNAQSRIVLGNRTSQQYDAAATLSLGDAFDAKATNASKENLAFAFSETEPISASYLTDAYNSDKLNASSNKGGIVELDKSVVYKDAKLVVSELKDMVAYTSVLAGLQDSQVELENGKTATEFEIQALQEAFSVSSEAYTTQIKTALDGVELVYYVNGTRQASSYVAELDGDKITPLVGTKPENLNGFGFKFGDELSTSSTTAFAGLYGAMGSKSNAFSIYHLRSAEGNLSDNTDVMVGVTATKGTPSYKTSAFEVNDLNIGETSTVTFTLKDASGIEYPLTLNVKKVK